MTHSTRRHFLATSAFAAAAALVDPRSLFAQDAPGLPEMVLQARAAAATAKITTQKLRGDVYALSGSGGNIAVLSAEAGKLVVDSGISSSRPQIVEALAAINADPVRGKVADLKKRGKTLEETIAAKPPAAYDDPWGKGFLNPPAFIDLVYQGV